MRKVSLDMIHVALMTVDRPRNYVHKAIAHLPKKIRMRLVVGSPHYDYLKRYRDKSRMEIIGVAPEDWEHFKDRPVPHRASWNYWRCFVHGVRPGARKGLLIFEDDVLPAKGWEKRLCETIEQIEAEYGEQYVLALYTAYTKLSKPRCAGQYYSTYPSHTFANTQAMYYPEPIRLAFGEYLKREGVDTFRLHYDQLMAEYLNSMGTPLLVTTPCLVQHIGEVSTGLSFAFHRAGCFSRNAVRKTTKHHGTRT
jgi:hypothetical protein